MKTRILIALLFLLGKVFSQGTFQPVTPTAYGSNNLRGDFQIALHIPFNNTGDFGVNSVKNTPQIRMVNGLFYIYNSTEWKEIQFASSLPSGYVTLGTPQTITALKTFTNGLVSNVIHADEIAGAGNPYVNISQNLVVNGTISRIGGLSSQFLKADGSVDATSYASVSFESKINSYHSFLITYLFE